jgi:glycosyltransferase involved in cell wall biosynthesis
MKLLSICIPTYNRNKEMAELAQNFLVPALNAYPDLIEVVVCDNSDSDVAERNQAVLDNRIQYRKNEINMGFAGNLLRCASEASATFIWIISDDDPILWAGFVELMDALPHANADGFDCVMLPFQTTNNFGDTGLSNRHTDWQVARDTSMAALLQSGQVPFILFSSAVIRLDKSMLLELKAKFFSNDYLQVILFLEMLKTDSPVRFMTTSTIDYQPEYKGRFRISSLASSMSEVRQYLYDKFGAIKDEKSDYRGWLLWLIHHHGGLYTFKDGDKERWKLLAILPRNLSVKNLVLAFALVLPSAVFRPIYIWYRSFKDMQRQGKLSFSEFRVRVATNKKFISSKLNRTV